MPGSNSTLFPGDLIDVIGQDRTPTLRELITLARRIWGDGEASRVTAAWSQLPRTSADRVWCLQAARLALCGAWSALAAPSCPPNLPAASPAGSCSNC